MIGAFVGIAEVSAEVTREALAEHREDLLEILAGDPSKFEWD